MEVHQYDAKQAQNAHIIERILQIERACFGKQVGQRLLVDTCGEVATLDPKPRGNTIALLIALFRIHGQQVGAA